MLCPPSWASSLKERVLKAGSCLTFINGLKIDKQKKTFVWDVCKLVLNHKLLVKILDELSKWLNISEPIFLIHNPHV